MVRRLASAFIFITLLTVALQSSPPAARAQEDGRVVTPRGDFSSLSEALEGAADGETIDVYGGVHEAPLIVERSVSLIGHDWPALDGGGHGTIMRLLAPNITVSGFVIRNSGDSLDQENSGIAVEAPGAILENNRFEETLFGIYLRKANNSVIRENVISSKDLAVPRRGDPIRVWYSNNVLIEGNHINLGRDVVLWYSEDLVIRNNEVSNGRYGLHFMYCDDAIIEDNLLTNNSVGTFMMYSRRLRLIHNTIAYNRGPSGYGIGLKDMDDAVVERNLFLDNRIGVYLDNSPREVDSVGFFQGNVFAFNDIGVNLMPSVRHNLFEANSFVDNEEQVGLAGGGGRAENNLWTAEERGNYWSDYVGFDADADGLGDVPYKAERLFENLMAQEPALRLFMYSPVEQAVEFAARAVPFVRPQPKLTDDLPMMEPTMPNDLPALPERQTWPMWAVSLGMMFLALGVLRLGSVERIPKLR